MTRVRRFFKLVENSIHMFFDNNFDNDGSQNILVNKDYNDKL